MFPGVNPKQMEKMMKQLGMKQEEVDAIRVTIELADNKVIIFDDPNVVIVNMGGQETFQVTGEGRLEEKKTFEILDEDVEMVVAQTNASKEDVRKALQETKGDIAEAIVKLQG